jgi:hypothetical protein
VYVYALPLQHRCASNDNLDIKYTFDGKGEVGRQYNWDSGQAVQLRQ